MLFLLLVRARLALPLARLRHLLAIPSLTPSCTTSYDPAAPRAEGESMGSGDFMSRPDARGRGGGFGTLLLRYLPSLLLVLFQTDDVCAWDVDDSRPPREELPLPTQAPWTAFVGNLAFDVGESDVANFFDGLTVRTPRTPRYVFEKDVADLVSLLFGRWINLDCSSTRSRLSTTWMASLRVSATSSFLRSTSLRRD
jgi:hypothetical protein